MSLSVYIITCNNETTLPQVLESVKTADEIIVVDSGSIDSTLEIAKRYTDRVIHQKWLGYAKQKAYAMSLCSHEWVLSLDSDEIIEAGGMERMRQLIINEKVNGYYLLRREYMLGEPIRGKRHKFMRLYRKDKALWDRTRLIHEHIDIEGEVQKTNITIHHANITNMTDGAIKIVTYGKLKAKQKIEQGKRTYGLKVLLIYPLMFIKYYLLEGYILSGVYGLIYAHLQANYFLMVEAFLYTDQKQKSSGKRS